MTWCFAGPRAGERSLLFAVHAHHPDANTVIHQSPKQATPTPSVDAQRAFRSKVLSLEQQLAALRRPFPHASSEASSEAPCFSCWVASPMNQKQWYHVACSENMTFEDLWKRVMANLQALPRRAWRTSTSCG